MFITGFFIITKTHEHTHTHTLKSNYGTSIDGILYSHLITYFNYHGTVAMRTYHTDHQLQEFNWLWASATIF